MSSELRSHEISPRSRPPSGIESDAVEVFSKALGQIGLSRDSAVGVWVGLKSKPMILLCGPEGIGKDTIALAVAKVITGNADEQVFQFQGHPWWATNGKNQGFLTRAQQNLTTYRLRALLEEARLTQDSGKYFFAVFQKISQAELSSFLLPLPEDFSTGVAIRLPTDLLDEIVLLPRNFYLLATMDNKVRWNEFDQSPSICTLFNLKSPPTQSPSLQQGTSISSTSLQSVLDTSRRFDPTLAWKNVPISRLDCDPIQVARDVLALLTEFGVRVHDDWIQDAYLYMGNAWSVAGEGLYHDDPDINSNKAFIFWFQHTILPTLEMRVQRDHNLGSFLLRQFSIRSITIPAEFEDILSQQT